jgi:hypothetical protein
MGVETQSGAYKGKGTNVEHYWNLDLRTEKASLTTSEWEAMRDDNDLLAKLRRHEELKWDQSAILIISPYSW